MDKKKVGLLGGTFDPIHNGHMALARQALTQFGLDQVIFIPTGYSYHKSTEGISTSEVRLHLTKLAAMENPCFSVSDIDIKRKGNTYTADTLEELLSEDPNRQLYYIVGEDSLDYMEKWYHAEYIFSHAIILAARRMHSELGPMEEKIKTLHEQFQGDIRILDCEVLPISSTEIRNRAKQGVLSHDLVPEAVLSYIIQHSLYQ